MPSFLKEMHLTIIESFRGLFGDLEGNLNKHIQDFQTDVDASETAKIESNYLQDVQEDIKEVFEDLKTEDENIADILKEVSDITSAKPPEFSDVDEWKRNAVKKAKEVDEDLDTFTGIGDEHDVETVLSQIESVMEQAQTSKGSARFSDFKGASNMKDLEKLQGYNEDKENDTSETSAEITKDNIDDLSMSEIEESNDTESKKLKDEASDVLNSAFQDLKDGKIGREVYLNVMHGLKSIANGAQEGAENIDLPEDFVNYLDENSEDMVEGSKKATEHGLKFSGVLKAYGLTKEGFKIERYKTKGKGKVGYKVHNPEVAGIQKPSNSKNRSHKIYYKDNIDKHAGKGKSGGKVPITDKVKPISGATSALRSKAGWAGVAIDAGFNLKDNIQDGESTQKVVGDAAVDVGIGAGTMAAAGAVSAFAVGTVGAPLIAGAAAGLVVSYGIDAVLKGKWWTSKSLKDHGKDLAQGTANTVKSGAKTVAGWFK